MKSNFFLEEIRKKYNYYLDLLEQKIKELFQEEFVVPEFITQGKRLRALAFMIVVKNYNLLNEITLNLAISIELLHTSSLIHDDIIDKDEIRREHPTLNKLYGNSVAVLSGDYVFIKSLEFANNYKSFIVINEFIKTSKNMVRGELLEEILSIEERLNKKTYLDIIESKTASLFEYALSCSAIVINKNVDDFKRAGKILGMAYQIIDDCEDFFEDIKKGKITLPLIYAYEHDRNLINHLYNEDYIREKIIDSKAFEKSLNLALNYLSEFENLINEELKQEFETYINYLKFRAFEHNNKFS